MWNKIKNLFSSKKHKNGNRTTSETLGAEDVSTQGKLWLIDPNEKIINLKEFQQNNDSNKSMETNLYEIGVDIANENDANSVFKKFADKWHKLSNQTLEFKKTIDRTWKATEVLKLNSQLKKTKKKRQKKKIQKKLEKLTDQEGTKKWKVPK